MRQKQLLLHYSFMLYLLLVLITACNVDASRDASSASSQDNNQQVTQLQFITTVDQLSLRKGPTFAEETIATLKKGMTLRGMGEVSTTISSKELRGIPFRESWHKVKNPSGQEGWVYGGGLTIDENTNTIGKELFLQQRLEGIFGKNIAEAIKHYSNSYQLINSAESFSLTYRKGLEVRDSIVKVLHEKIKVDDPVEPIDISWLELAMPGFKIQLVAEGTLFHLFADYNKFIEKAAITPQPEDDEFIKLNSKIYAPEKIERFYPNWFVQTWDHGGQSLLGKGIHLQIFRDIEKLQNTTHLFTPELINIKNALLEDITAEWVTYKLPKKAILNELTKIINANLACLLEDDKILLQQRRVAFENPTDNKIELNLGQLD